MSTGFAALLILLAVVDEGLGAVFSGPSEFAFFPGLISGPFQHGLIVVFAFAAVLSALAALASSLRGTRPASTPADPD
jgi:hypothetical protein